MQSQTEPGKESKVCESCGETFGCGARLDGCWCAGVQLADDILADLKQKFSDCLCPNCLDSLAETEANV